LNWRAAGCLVIGSVVFIGVGLLGLSLATSHVGCFNELQTSDGVYRASGSVTSAPALAGGGEPLEIGTTLVGLSTRRVYGPPGTDVNDVNAPRPPEISIECGDGTYQGYLLEPGPPGAT
jgi:hypothetical protein